MDNIIVHELEGVIAQFESSASAQGSGSQPASSPIAPREGLQPALGTGTLFGDVVSFLSLTYICTTVTMTFVMIDKHCKQFSIKAKAA